MTFLPLHAYAALAEVFCLSNVRALPGSVPCGGVGGRREALARAGAQSGNAVVSLTSSMTKLAETSAICTLSIKR